MLNINENSGISTKINSLEQELRTKMETTDELSTKDLLELQHLTESWSNLVNLESSLMKKQNDMISRIIERI